MQKKKLTEQKTRDELKRIYVFARARAPFVIFSLSCSFASTGFCSVRGFFSWPRLAHTLLFTGISLWNSLFRPRQSAHAARHRHTHINRLIRNTTNNEQDCDCEWYSFFPFIFPICFVWISFHEHVYSFHYSQLFFVVAFFCISTRRRTHIFLACKRAQGTWILNQSSRLELHWSGRLPVITRWDFNV